MRAQGYALTGYDIFPDHHAFSETEVQKLLAIADPLITTEKDMARLRGAAAGSPHAELAARADILPIELNVQDEADLWARINHALAEGQANQRYTSY